MPCTYSMSAFLKSVGTTTTAQPGLDSLNFDGVIDTIVGVLGFEETNDSYKTSLSPKFYLSGTYKIMKSFDAGLAFYGEINRKKLRPALGISLQKRFGKIFSVGGVYALRNGRFDNLGLNFGLKLGPVQLYGTSDNIISVFKPLDSKSTNFRLGLNIAVGKKKNTE